MHWAREIRTAPPTWVRGWAHIEDGDIVIDSPELYEPYSEEGIWDAFVLIESVEDALEFATRFGLLHKGPDRQGPIREPYQYWQEQGARLGMTAHLYIALQQAAEGDADALQRLWDWGPQWIWGPRSLVAATDVPPDDPWLQPPENDRDLLDRTTYEIVFWLNNGLQQTEMAISPSFVAYDDQPGRFILAFYPSDLLGFIYQEFTDLVTRLAELRYCEGCGRPYLVRDPRQRFCNAQCANRARQRRHKAKQKIS